MLPPIVQKKISLDKRDNSLEIIKKEFLKNKYPSDINFDSFFEFLNIIRNAKTNLEVDHYLDKSTYTKAAWNDLMEDMRQLASKTLKGIFTRIQRKLKPSTDQFKQYDSTESLNCNTDDGNSSMELH